MANDIDSYLRELQTALCSGGADPALVQDALFDAEEYLQAEMAVGGVAGRGTATYEARFAAAAQGYGSAEEVAAAYLGTVPAYITEAATESPVQTPIREQLKAKEEVEFKAISEPIPAVAPEALEAAVETTSVREALVATGATGTGTPLPCSSLPTGVQAGIAAAGMTDSAGDAVAPSVWRQILGVFADGRVWKSLLYMIISLGTGIAYFTIVVTGLSTAGGMLILIIGLPLFLLVLGMIRGMALFEGRVVELLLGTRMPRRPRAEPPNVGFFQRMWFWLRDGRTWASTAYMILMLPLGVAYFTIAVTGIATGVALITTPLWAWAAWVGDHRLIYDGVVHDWWFPVWGIPLAMIVGALILIALMHVVKWIGRGHAAFAKAMLVRLAK